MAPAKPQVGIKVRDWGSVSRCRLRFRGFGAGCQGVVSIDPTSSIQDHGGRFGLNIRLGTWLNMRLGIGIAQLAADQLQLCTHPESGTKPCTPNPTPSYPNKRNPPGFNTRQASVTESPGNPQTLPPLHKGPHTKFKTKIRSEYRPCTCLCTVESNFRFLTRK